MELAAAAEYYAEVGPAVAEAFELEFRRAVVFILENPRASAVVGDGSTRRLQLRRFPWLIIYSFEADMVEILAIAHTRRRPGYWSDRV